MLFANAATDSQTPLLIHNEDEQHNHANVEGKSLGDGSWTTLPFIHQRAIFGDGVSNLCVAAASSFYLLRSAN
jgi:hypothetical protein